MKAVVGGQTKEITAPPHMYGDQLNRLHDIMLLKLPEGPKIEHIIHLPECKPVHTPPEWVQSGEINDEVKAGDYNIYRHRSKMVG